MRRLYSETRNINKNRGIKSVLTALLTGVVMGGAFILSGINAEAATGWNQDYGGWWYEDASGYYPSNEWREIDGEYYYFNGSGYAVTGWQTINGYHYYFYQSGVLARDTYIGGDYVNADGVWIDTTNMPGWKQQNGRYWYRFEDGTYPYHQWYTVDGEDYYFDNDGYVMTGWLNYYGTYYYLQASGAAAKDTWIDGYYLDETGKWTDSETGEEIADGWVMKAGEWYYYMNGVPYKGWMNIPGSENYYYFYTDDDKEQGTPGAMAHDTYVDGWYITINGISNSATSQARDIVESYGGTLRGAYSYATSLSYEGKYTYTEDWGSAALANHGFSNGSGNCYVMAACFYELALVLGYDPHQIAGNIALGGGSQGTHSWVEIDEPDGTWVYDPNLTMQYSRDAFRFHYGKPGTWVYVNYHRMN